MRYLFLFIIFVPISIQAQIDLWSTFPQKVEIGKEYNVQVHVNKDGLYTMGELTLVFPKGSVLSDIETNGGDFKLYQNTLEVIWSPLPQNYEVIVKFKYKFSPKKIPTSITYKMKFSYLLEGGKGEKYIILNYKQVQNANNVYVLSQ